MNLQSIEKRPCVLITGAANGIGRATARLFVQHGWFVGLGDIDGDGLDTLQQELGVDNALAMVLDVTKADVIQTTEVNDSTKIPSSAVTYALGQAMGKIKIIEFNPESGTIDLNTLTEPYLYRFAGAVSVINDPYDEFMRDQTMLVTGGAMSFQITIKNGEIAYRSSFWTGDFGPWYKITNTIMTTDKDQTMAAKLKAQNNTDYTTAQVRNIILSPNEAVAGLMGEGDIWIQYEAGED